MDTAASRPPCDVIRPVGFQQKQARGGNQSPELRCRVCETVLGRRVSQTRSGAVNRGSESQDLCTDNSSLFAVLRS